MDNKTRKGLTTGGPPGMRCPEPVPVAMATALLFHTFALLKMKRKQTSMYIKRTTATLVGGFGDFQAKPLAAQFRLDVSAVDQRNICCHS